MNKISETVLCTTLCSEIYFTIVVVIQPHTKSFKGSEQQNLVKEKIDSEFIKVFASTIWKFIDRRQQNRKHTEIIEKGNTLIIVATVFLLPRIRINL